MNQFALVGIFENYKKVLIAVFPSKLEAEIAQNLLEDTLSETVYEDYQVLEYTEELELDIIKNDTKRGFTDIHDTYEFKNKICGIESIEIFEDKYQLNHDDNYYNESYTKEDLLLFLKEIENFFKTD